jgi:hypothetical protein
MDDEKWEIACTASGITHANIILGRLETEGIPVRLKYESAVVVYPVTIDGLGEVEVLVPERHLERARQILSQSYDEEELDWEGSG